MSRKTIMAILGVIGAILVFFQQQFGLTLDATAIVGGLTAIVLYVLFEAKLDLKRIVGQVGKFKDPKFWLAFISALLVALQSAFGWNLPIEAIVSVLTVIMSILFAKDFAKAKQA